MRLGIEAISRLRKGWIELYVLKAERRPVADSRAKKILGPNLRKI